MNFENKKILILGNGKSGFAVAQLLASKNNNLIITDKKTNEEKEQQLANLNIKSIICDNQETLLDESFDYVIKSPGIPDDTEVIKKAKQLNITITNELEVAYHFLPKVKIIGITGSNGKTTTTQLIYEILKEVHSNVHIGGNIGIPLSQIVNKIKENDILILELSAHQLSNLLKFKIDIAIITNITETHLEHFKTYENYVNSKKRILKDCELVVTNANNKECLNITQNYKRILFDIKNMNNIYLNQFIIYNNEPIINQKDIVLKGNHNIENIMAAVGLAKYLHINNEVIFHVLSKFKGVEHRLEYVENIKDISIYNDSKSTNIEATKKAIESLENPIILLLGGKDNNQNYEKLNKFTQKIKCIIAFGESKEKIFKYANKHSIPCFLGENLKKSTKKSFDYASKGDIILLSPAGSSIDQYQNFEKRGEDFKNIIKEIKDENKRY